MPARCKLSRISYPMFSKWLCAGTYRSSKETIISPLRWASLDRRSQRLRQSHALISDASAERNTYQASEMTALQVRNASKHADQNRVAANRVSRLSIVRCCSNFSRTTGTTAELFESIEHLATPLTDRALYMAHRSIWYQHDKYADAFLVGTSSKCSVNCAKRLLVCQVASPITCASQR